MTKELLRFRGTTIEKVDDPIFYDRIASGLRRYRYDFRKLNNIYPELVRDHLHEWVAIYDGKLYTAPTIEGLKREAKRDSVDINEAVYMYIITEQELRSIVV